MSKPLQIRKRVLGRTGLTVTELGLGGYMFTGEFGVPQSEAHAILDLALESGINYIDTAAMYGFGEGEELVGRALARHPRWQVHVSTKVGWLDRTVVRNLGDKAYRDEAALRRAIEHSFWLLRRDYIDVFMIHEPNTEAWWGLDRQTGDAVVTRVLEDYKRQGRIGAIGLGGWDCDHMADMVATGRFDVALVAGGYTLVHQKVRERVIPAARKHNVGLVMGGTFLQGFLARPQRERLVQMQQTQKYEGWMNATLTRRVLAVYDLCETSGLSLPEMCLRYILRDPDIHTIIPGAQQVAHLRENLAAAAKGPLPDELAGRIDAINRLE